MGPKISSYVWKRKKPSPFPKKEICIQVMRESLQEYVNMSRLTRYSCLQPAAGQSWKCPGFPVSQRQWVCEISLRHTAPPSWLIPVAPQSPSTGSGHQSETWSWGEWVKHTLSLVILGVRGRLKNSLYIRCCQELEQLFLNQFKYSDRNNGATMAQCRTWTDLGTRNYFLYWQ